MRGGFPYNHCGRKVVDSPKSSRTGTVTNVSHAGFPEVDGVAVAWVELEGGEVFDPYGVREKHLAERAK